MTRTVGTTVRGIRTPIVKTGDNLVEMVVNSLKKSWEKVTNSKIGILWE